MRRERSRLLAAQMKELPAERQGELILGLLGNALLTVALQASWLALLLRAARAVARQRDCRPGPMLRAVWSPPLGLVTGALVGQRLINAVLLREMERRMLKGSDGHAP